MASIVLTIRSLVSVGSKEIFYASPTTFLLAFSLLALVIAVEPSCNVIVSPFVLPISFSSPDSPSTELGVFSKSSTDRRILTGKATHILERKIKLSLVQSFNFLSLQTRILFSQIGITRLFQISILHSQKNYIQKAKSRQQYQLKMQKQQQNLYPKPNLISLTTKSNRVYNGNNANRQSIVMGHNVVSYHQEEEMEDGGQRGREEREGGVVKDDGFGVRFGSIKRNKVGGMSGDGAGSWVRSGSFTNSHTRNQEQSVAPVQQTKHELLQRPNPKAIQKQPQVPPLALPAKQPSRTVVKPKREKEAQLEEINKYFNNDSEQEESSFVAGQEIELGLGKGRQGIRDYDQRLFEEESKRQRAEEKLYQNFGINPPSLQNPKTSLSAHNNRSNNSNSQALTSPKLQRKQSDSPSEFIDSRQSYMKSHPTKYGPGGIQTLQFNPEKQKLIILDSKETENVNLNPYNSNILAEFCQNIVIPPLEKLPNPENSPDELVKIAKHIFTQFAFRLTDQTTINVKKYRNCVFFSIDLQNNVLYHYENGKLYYGGWKMMGNGEGEKYGEGVEILPGRYKFRGYFVEGKKSGAGTLIGYDGSAYVGQWENGMKHGSGRQLDSDGIIYEGQWKEGKRSGYGKLINNGRLEFEGVFSKGLKNGYGKQYFENGDTYDGNYLNHKFQGKGTYCWASGATYTGQFRYGKRNGYGVWRSNDQNYDQYEGEYVDDKKHGHGVYRWSNGAVYDGEFREDLKHGQGRIVYENGKIANLVWKNGKAERKVGKDGEDEGSGKREGLERKIGTRNSAVSSQPQLHAHIHSQHQGQTQSQSRLKNNNFVLRSRPSSRSTQNLHSATSNSTRNSQNFAKGIAFHTRTAQKPIKLSEGKTSRVNKEEQKVIRLKFDNNQFQKTIGKNWNKTLFNANGNGQGHGRKESANRPQLPRDRPYQGIQNSTNINMDL